MMTIQNLSSSRDPYTQVLKAKVIKVSPLGWKRHQTAGGLELMKLTVMLADPTGYVKAVVFGEKFGQSIVQGRSVALKNYIYQDGHMKIVAPTKVLRLIYQNGFKLKLAIFIQSLK